MIGSFLRKAQLTGAAGAPPPPPSWTLDFSSGSPWANGTDYTYSSLRTAGTYVDSSGYIAPNAANLLLRSQDLLNAAWVKRGTGSVSATLASAPDGTVTANELSGINTGSNDVYQLVTTTGIASGTAISPSFWIQKVSSSGVVTFQNAATSANGSWTINLSLLGTGWERITSSHPAVTVSTAMTVAAGSQGAGMMWKAQSGGPLSFSVWGTQIAVGTDPLPYSATTTSSNGIPRLMHNSSGSRLGLLVEGGATNLLLQSAAVRSASWTTGGLTTAGPSITAPDGTANGVEIVGSNGTVTGGAFVYQGVVASEAVAYTASIFLKAKGTALNTTIRMQSRTGVAAISNLSVTFNNTTGAVGTVASGTWTSTSATSTPVGNDWYRVTLTGTTPATTTLVRLLVLFDDTSNGTDGVYAWGAQVESQAFASSYIPTTTQSVTRAAELVHVPDSKITSWGDGALVVHFYPPSQSGTLLSTDDAATAQVGIEANPVTDVRAFWSSGSTASETMTTGLQKAAHYWKGSASKFCLNGGPVRSGGNDLVIGNTDFVTLGAEATDSAGVPGTFSKYSYCIVCKVEFYSGTLTDAQLQAITT